jgi:hypothetical protein
MAVERCPQERSNLSAISIPTMFPSIASITSAQQKCVLDDCKEDCACSDTREVWNVVHPSVQP